MKKTIRQYLCLMLTVALVVALLPTGTTAQAKTSVPVFTMTVGETVNASDIAKSVTGKENCTLTAVKSSKKSVVAVKKGNLTAKKAGKTTVSFKESGKKYKVTVTVTKPLIKVSMLDVGQGDSFLIQTANTNILIDTGEYREYTNLKKQLAALGCGRIDILVATHFDTDHYGSAQSILKDFGKDALFVHPSRPSEYSTYTNLMAYVSRNNVKELVLTKDSLGSIDAMNRDGMMFTLLSADAGEDTNDSSLVFRLDYAGSSWMFTGDAPAAVLDEIAAKDRKSVDVDVFKVSHHGSAYSNPIAFIKYASPKISLIGVGKDNEHGHPATTTMSRLIKFSESIYRTDADGGITVTYDGKYTVTTLEGKKAGDGQATPEGQVIGNAKSLVCHLPGCTSLPAEKNRVYFDSIADAEEAGYKPCGYCCK